MKGRKHCPKGIKDEFPHFGTVRDVGISYAPWTAVKEKLMKLWGLNLVDSLRRQWESEENGSLIVIVSTNQVISNEIMYYVVLESIDCEWGKVGTKCWLL